MHSSTKAELVETLTGTVGSLAKEFLVRRNEMNRLEQEAQYQKEIEELRAQNRGAQRDATGGDHADSDDPVVSSLNQASELAEQYDELLAEAEKHEECELCRSLISATRQKPVTEQRELIPELRDFLEKVDDDADRDELVAQIKESDNLMSLLREQMEMMERAASGGESSSDDNSSSQRNRRRASRTLTSR